MFKECHGNIRYEVPLQNLKQMGFKTLITQLIMVHSFRFFFFLTVAHFVLKGVKKSSVIKFSNFIVHMLVESIFPFFRVQKKN
jgi:hypothetical protein